ncbi:MAG: hypothetical protein A2Y81_08920 [Nitrospirae bacterium RBG_13_43_8]|nr:MAG: hypothetical protein A2Y81_08920 [Nitrospirae bacterium RBG_13_43_8]
MSFRTLSTLDVLPALVLALSRIGPESFFSYRISKAFENDKTAKNDTENKYSIFRSIFLSFRLVRNLSE